MLKEASLMRILTIFIFAIMTCEPVFGQAVNINGNLTFNPTTSGVVGTTTNDDAAPGVVGEFISATLLKSSSVSLTNGATSNVLTLSLTRGDWDVWGEANTNPAPATVQALNIAGLSLSSATLPTALTPNGAATDTFSVPAGIGSGLVFPTARISVASGTTVYLVIMSNFSGGTNGVYGFMAARRAR